MAAVLAALARSAAGTAKGDVAVALAFDPQVGAWRCAVAGPVSAGDGWIAHLEGTHPIRPDVIRLARRAGLNPLGIALEATTEGGAVAEREAEAGLQAGALNGAPGLLAVLRRAQGGAALQERETLEQIAALGALALRGARAEARVAELEGEREEQQQFLSITAHDLRSPLAAIRGYAQLLLRQAGPEAPAGPRNGLQTIVQQSDRLADLTELVLDVARVQSRRLALQRVTADLGQVVREAARSLQGSPGAPGQRGAPGLPGEPAGPALVLRLAEALPRVQGDLDRLSQIVRALLQYALARTPDGAAVTVDVHPDAGTEAGPAGPPRRRGEGGAGVMLLVQDEGPALPEEECQGLFSRLVRPAGEGRSATLGALHLFVARGAAEAHGGRAWAESPASPGEGGLRLAVWLPTGAAGAAGAAG
jgi:signal transduction histidine kinase